MADFGKLAGDVLAAYVHRDAKAEELKEAGDLVTAAELAMFEAMVEAEISDQTVLGHKFGLDISTHYSCLAGNRTALYESLKPYERDGIFKTTVEATMRAEEAAALHERLSSAGLDDLFAEKFTVHASTLQATMREWERDGGIPAEVAEILSVYDERKLVVKEAKRR